MMLTMLNLKRGEGNIVVASPQASSRRAHLPQSSPQVSPQVSSKASLVIIHEGWPENMT